jgi:hypothetical protein
MEDRMSPPSEAHSASSPAAGPQVTLAESHIPQEWWDDFEAAARRPLVVRIRYSFIHTYKPVLDEARFRAFDTMEQYRQWCEDNLREWLGYGRVSVRAAVAEEDLRRHGRQPVGLPAPMATERRSGCSAQRSAGMMALRDEDERRLEAIPKRHHQQGTDNHCAPRASSFRGAPWERDWLA